MPGRLKGIAFGLALAAALGLALWRTLQPGEPRFARDEFRPAPAGDAAPLFQRTFIAPEGVTAMVHSGTLTELPDGGLLAAWFGGSREGAADVAIYGARRPPCGGWSAPFVITGREDSERSLGRHLRKLGNPVLYTGADGRVWLFYVTVSIGGWSTSSISYRISEDGGRSWGAARRLVTSPLLNLSTLVRARPLGYRDGGIALPAYHEMAGKFGELLRIAPDGRVLDKARLGSGRSGIQPTLAATSAHNARAFLRRVGDAPPRVLSSRSDDGGAHWSPLEATGIPNPDASVAVVTTPSGGFLMACNDLPQGRQRLVLARSGDGLKWQRLAILEQGEPGDEFSYPYLLRDRRGDYQLIYTWQRRRMVHISFNDAWLEGLK